MTVQLHDQEACPWPTSLHFPALTPSCIPSWKLESSHANYTHPLQTAMCWPSTLVNTDQGKRSLQALEAGLRLQSAKLPASRDPIHLGTSPESHKSLHSKRQIRVGPAKNTRCKVGTTLVLNISIIKCHLCGVFFLSFSS